MFVHIIYLYIPIHTRHGRDRKSRWSWISKSQSHKIIQEILVLRNLVSVWSKFLRSGWKSLILRNRCETRHFPNNLFSRCLILISFKQKISFKHHLTPNNLITVLFNTKKSQLSVICYWEIYEILWNSLKRDATKKISFKQR